MSVSLTHEKARDDGKKKTDREEIKRKKKENEAEKSRKTRQPITVRQAIIKHNTEEKLDGIIYISSDIESEANKRKDAISQSRRDAMKFQMVSPCFVRGGRDILLYSMDLEIEGGWRSYERL